MPGPLKNQRHELFCQWVAKGTPAYIAYGKAGYKVEGVSEDHVRSNASRMNSYDNIASRIKELQLQGAEKAAVEIADVLNGFLRIANADIAEAFDAEGNLKPIHEIPKDLRLAMSSVQTDELFAGPQKIGVTRKLKFEPKVKAWEHLGRHLRMFVDRIEHGGLESLAEALNEARNRNK